MLNLRLLFAIVLCFCAVLVMASPYPANMHMQRNEMPKRQLKQLKLKRGDVLRRWDEPKPPKPSKFPSPVIPSIPPVPQISIPPIPQISIPPIPPIPNIPNLHN